MRRFILSCALALATIAPALADSGVYPNPRLTPGDVFPVTAMDVCTPGYSAAHRYVTVATKRHVYEAYGVEYVAGEHEVDHLIALELGGSNSVRNLWPESYSGDWNARVKDRLESKLHELVCNGELPLATAQQMIASDWVAAYRRFLGPDPNEDRYYPRYRRNRLR